MDPSVSTLNPTRKFAAFRRLSLFSVCVLLFLAVFLFFFLIYPLGYVFTHISGALFFETLKNSVVRESIFNSLIIGFMVTILTTFLALPMAFMMVRRDFPAKSLVGGLILIPMIMPPFVGALGVQKLVGRAGIISWLLGRAGMGPVGYRGADAFYAVIILEVLHLYPIMYMNVSAAMANVDPALEEAGRGLGASGLRLFRTITWPLMAPGFFAGSAIVFIWAFTDLGTPLIFQFDKVVPVRIYNALKAESVVDPSGYSLVVFTLVLSAAIFLGFKAALGKSRGAASKGSTYWRPPKLSRKAAILFFMVLGLFLAVALMPHFSLILMSISEKWKATPLPTAWTTGNFSAVFRDSITAAGIRNSLFLSAASTLFNVVLGLLLAYLLTRGKLPFTGILDVLAMMPLAIPGVVLAFGYVTAYSGTFLSPWFNPFPLLIIGYAVRRLPFMLRASYAGFQQAPVAFEEASADLGAAPFATFRKITFPLILANVTAGCILSFSFSMLEVSESLMLSLGREKFYPVTAAIVALSNGPARGQYTASALGILGMLLLMAGILGAARLMGRRMGEMFRV